VSAFSEFELDALDLGANAVRPGLRHRTDAHADGGTAITFVDETAVHRGAIVFLGCELRPWSPPSEAREEHLGGAEAKRCSRLSADVADDVQAWRHRRTVAGSLRLRPRQDALPLPRKEETMASTRNPRNHDRPRWTPFHRQTLRGVRIGMRVGR